MMFAENGKYVRTRTRLAIREGMMSSSASCNLQSGTRREHSGAALATRYVGKLQDSLDSAGSEFMGAGYDE